MHLNKFWFDEKHVNISVVLLLRKVIIILAKSYCFKDTEIKRIASGEEDLDQESGFNTFQLCVALDKPCNLSMTQFPFL